MIKLVIALLLTCGSLKAEEALWGGELANRLVGWTENIGRAKYLWAVNGKYLGYIENENAKEIE